MAPARLLLIATALPLIAAAAETKSPLLDGAFQDLYNSNYAGAQSEAGKYIAAQPRDPLGYAVRGSAYLFSELDRLGLLESEFFESDHRLSDSKKKLHPDPGAQEGFYNAVGKAQSLAQASLAQSPDDTNALFAMCLTLGEQVDYMALIEKKQLASLSVNKRAYREAKHLLTVDPKFVDAYLTTGFTEYLVGALPAVVRWFVRFDDVQGNKEQGFQNLQIVADRGNYLKPLAKILLATGYLREKKPLQARQLLADLSHQFPSNLLLRREFEKVSARIHSGR